jgi:hypothetical protein
MTNSKNKAKLTATAILIAVMATGMLAIMPANAQTTYTNQQEGGSIPLPSGVKADLELNTIPHMSFRPNPVGLGEEVLVNVWMQPPLHVARYFKDAFQVTMTKQDGTKVIKTASSYRADSTGWFEFIADQVGNWTLKLDFLGAYFPAGNYTRFPGGWVGAGVDSFPTSCYYKPSSTDAIKLVVQEEPVSDWPASPLPTDYWTRPISPENREWWTIAGDYPWQFNTVGYPDWPEDTNHYPSNYLYTPFVQAPNSAHIVWKRQVGVGGLYGPAFPQDAYGGPVGGAGGGPTLVYQGRCYQTVTKVMSVLINGTYYQQPTSVWQCYDLRTGEVYWEQTGVPAASYIMHEPGWGEVPGGDPSFGRNVFLVAISGGRLIKYDPYTGAIASYGGFFGGGGVYNVSISPLSSGTYYSDPYFLTVQDLGSAQGANRYRLINWTVHGDPGSSASIINVGLRVYNNISWPFSSLGTVDYDTGVAVTTSAITNPATGPGVTIDVRLMGASIYNRSPNTNNLLWNVSSTVGYGTFPASCADQGKFAARFNDGKWHAFDLTDGHHVWSTEYTTFPWGTFGCYGVQSFGGMIISNQYDGIAAYNWTNGNLVWFYQYKAQYPYATPYQDNYPWFTGTGRIADGKLYTYNTEHTVTQPVTRGWRMHCVNITTGEGIWSIAGSMAPGAVADGYLTATNFYDSYQYVFGKGKSATTVTASPKASVMGDEVLIEGTVTDLSPAQPGKACVSDESMASWMEYLHLQRPMPTNATGVDVTLAVVDANGNYREIGTATSDISGTFSYVWQPDIPGKYTVVASFKGTESYGSSFAETAFTVAEAPPAEEPSPTINTVVANPNLEMYIAIATVLIIVAIAVIGMLLLRKKP